MGKRTIKMTHWQMLDAVKSYLIAEGDVVTEDTEISARRTYSGSWDYYLTLEGDGIDDNQEEYTAKRRAEIKAENLRFLKVIGCVVGGVILMFLALYYGSPLIPDSWLIPIVEK